MPRTLRLLLVFPLALLLPGPLHAEETPPTLEAGFSVVDLTPDRAVPLGGYGARLGRPSQGVHDPIEARAVVFRDEDTTVAMVSLDLVGVSRRMTETIEHRVEDLGLDLVVLAATHTHAGPGGLTEISLWRPAMGHFDGSLFLDIAVRIELAIRLAHADLAPARARLMPAAKHPELVRNRRGQATFDAGRLGVLRIDAPDGTPRGVLVHFAAHPTILSAKDRELSAGWPGAMRRELERRIPKATAIYWNGAMGDLSPVAPKGASRWARMEAYGKQVAGAALDLFYGSTPSGRDRPLTSVDVALDRVIPAPTTVAHLLGVETEHAFLGFYPLRTAVIRLGDHEIATVPGEPSDELGHRISGGRHWVLSCAMDHLGYFVTPEAFRRADSYEAELSLFGPEVTARLGRILSGAASAHPCGPPKRPPAPLRVRGDTARKLGLEHGFLLGSAIHDLLADAEAEMESEVLRHGGGLLLAPYALAIGAAPRDLVVPLLIRAARKLQPYVPQAYLEEMEGIAEGAGVPYDAILLENVFLTLAEQPDKTALLSMPVRCTNLVAMGDATSMGQLIHGSTLDWGMRNVLKDRVISLIVEPPGGHPFVSITWPGMVGTLRAMGAQGIAITEESCAAKHDTTWRGVPVNLLMRDVVEHAGSLEDAVRRVTEAKGTCGYKITISDGRSLDARVIEVTANHHHVRKPAKGLLFGCDPEAPCLGGCDEAIPRNDGSSARRYPAVRKHLGTRPQSIRVGDVAGALGQQEGGVLNKGTLLGCIFEPQTGRYHVARGADVDPGRGALVFRPHDLMVELSPDLRDRYSPPWPVRDIGEVTTRVKLKNMGGIRVEEVVFHSPIDSGSPGNDRVVAELFTPLDPKGVVIQLPHWKDPSGAQGQRVIAFVLARMGVASLLVPLPWQYGRTPKGKRTGEWTLSRDLARTREAAFQGAADVARASLWLEKARGYGPKRQGLMGLSLGGHTASLALGAYPERFAAGAFLLAGSHDGGGLFRKNGVTDRITRELTRRGVDVEEAKGLLAAIDPAALARRDLADRILIVAGDDDPVVPKPSVEALAAAWGGAEIRYFSGGHYDVVLHAFRILGVVSKHFAARFEAD